MNLDTSYFSLFSKYNFQLDINILNFIYTPILNSNAYCIYTMLFSQAKCYPLNSKVIFSLKLLRDLTGIKFSIIKSSFKKLEAVKLIETFYNKDDNELIFNISEPLNFDDFFANKKFKKLFIKKTSKNYLEFITNFFVNERKINNNFKNISQSFKYKIFNDNLDLDLDFLDSDYEEETSSDDKILKNNLTQLNDNIDNSKNENYNDDHKLNELKNASVETNDAAIIKSWENFYPPNLKAQKIVDMKNIEPDKYLKILKGKELNEFEFNIISLLLTKQKLKFEVVNCLIDYVYLTNEKIIHKEYITKISESFVRYEIKSAEEAMLYLEKAFYYKNNKDFQKNKDFIFLKKIELNNNEEVIKKDSDYEVDPEILKVLC